MNATKTPTLGIPKESIPETRVALSPDSAKKLIQTYGGVIVRVESGAGVASAFPDDAYVQAGCQIVSSAKEAFAADIVLKMNKPTTQEIAQFQKGAMLLCYMEPFKTDGTLEALNAAGVSAFSMELIPRTSRAQSMDALSSQANIAGYRAVIEAAAQYPRFFPVMMTSAGSAKAVRVAVLGAGVAGLQAIATARRLGAQVEAFDVRPEVKEQILSLGAKFMDLGLQEEGTGQGGYAKALSEEGQKKQQAALAERLKKFDVVITTANIPGRKAPILVTESAVQGMRAGSVVIDMAAENGGNCAYSEAGKTIVTAHGVKIVGVTNFPALVPFDSSSFYAKNLVNLLGLMLKKDKDTGAVSVSIDLNDDILAASLMAHEGVVRFQKK